MHHPEGDNSADCNHEVTLMGHVYRNSYCNLAAGAAVDGDCSLFITRQPMALCSPLVSVKLITGECVSYILYNEDIWHGEIFNAHINTRAWVLQERLLSSRVITFGSRQIMWECRHQVAAEIYPKHLRITSTTVHAYRKPNLEASLDRTRRLLVSGRRLHDEHYTWLSITEWYSRCKLTVASDKLIAISSVAKIMGEILNDTYHAGLWKRNFVHGMLWQRTVATAESQVYIVSVATMLQCLKQFKVSFYTPKLLFCESFDAILTVRCIY